MDELTIPEATAASLRRLRGASAMMTHRPAWATENELAAMRQTVQNLLLPTGYTATAEALDGLAKMIPMPKDETARLVYVEALKDFPPDVLAKGCKSVVLSHLSQRPPNVAVIVKACREDADYQRRLGWQRGIDALSRKPVKPVHQKPTADERQRVVAGFEALREGRWQAGQ